MKPVVYDFKRLFIRASTLIALILFTVAGVGLAYITTQTVVTRNPQELYGGIVLYRLDPSRGVLELIPGVYDHDLKPVDVKISVQIHSLKNSTVINLGDYRIKGDTPLKLEFNDTVKQYFTPLDSALWINYGVEIGGFTIREGGRLLESAPLVPQNNTISMVFSGCFNLGSYGIEDAGYIIPGSDDTGVARDTRPCYSIIPTSGKIYVIAGVAKIVKEPVSLYYNVSKVLYNSTDQSTDSSIYMRYEETMCGVDTRNVSLCQFKLLGSIEEGMKIYQYTISVPSEVLDDSKLVCLTMVYTAGNSTGVYQYILNLRGAAEVVTASIMQAGISLFSSFFPVIMLYLAYTSIAKPKSQGALEFILARPVTRTDVYITRYTAGVLVALVAPALLVASLYIGIRVLLHITLSSSDLLLIYTGLAASLVAFYTLVYYAAVELKGSLYLATAIGLYVFFLVVIKIIGVITSITVFHATTLEEFTRIQLLFSYFNPLQLLDLITAPITYKSVVYEGMVNVVREVVKPEYIALAFTAWTLIPFILGLYRFKRKDLSS
ncbi:MAG: ABC transporter permease subunit [Desulfurococcus sp.]|nr:ABC transporter permease subunit [Desulfurococcus sp.]